MDRREGGVECGEDDARLLVWVAVFNDKELRNDIGYSRARLSGCIHPMLVDALPKSWGQLPIQGWRH